MSTDDSVSEDVSTSGALSHGHDGEASLPSSEDTAAPGRRSGGGAGERRAGGISPACSKIRSLCLSTEEALQRQKNLPFINPSSLETLRALVQEIRSSGETDPEIWKDCEGRWLHLFQLVEKQYQEQILAQQEQYQCQIQLIQDEIKALVQLQNRQASVPPHPDFPPPPETKPAAEILPLAAPQTIPQTVPPDHTAFSSPSPPPHGPDPDPDPDPDRRAGERTATVLSSGYGTLSAWESSGLEPAGSPGAEEDEENEEEGGERGAALYCSLQQEVTDQKRNRTLNPAGHQQKPSSSSSQQQLTSWAQRTRLRPRRGRAGPAGPAEAREQPPETHPDPQDQPPAAGARCFPLRRSDSLTSDTSGLTYWRLNEGDLYRPLPDSFDSGAFLLLLDASPSPTPSQEPRLSLREIYQSKQREDWRRCDWDGSGPSSPQVFTLDPAASARQSDRTSGFTSPSHFSSPSFAAPPHPSPSRSPSPSPSPRAGSPGSPHPGDTDCTSDASAAGAPPPAARGSWGHAPPQRGGSEEEGSHTHTSTLKPPPAPEDPVVLSLLRQNLRQKHSRHLADLKAFYEAEIQTLRDQLRLSEPQEQAERENRELSLRCQHLEAAVSEASARVQQLEAANASLEKKLAEWPERHAATAAALQQRLDQSRRSGRDKDGLVARLRTRVQQLEEEAQEQEERRGRGDRMLQELLGEYDALMKEHQGTKSDLAAAENRLLDANDQISDLKRLVSKLESQVKQMEHENQARTRFSVHSSSQPSGAGLFHHPDLLLAPSKGQTEPDVTRRKSPSGDRKRPSQKPPSRRSEDQSGSSSVEAAPAGGGWRSPSPPQVEPPPPAGRREGGAAVLTPVMRALIELEETRATQTRAPWLGSPRTTVGFLERRHKESIQERVELDPGGGGGGAGGGGGGARRSSAVEKAAALLRTQRSLSPEGTRSASLPPPAQRANTHTPMKRETLLAPLSGKSSPKRCPTENYSTAFGHPLPREEHLRPGTDGQADRRRHSFTSSRKRLQFSTDGEPDWSGPPGPPAGAEEVDRVQSLSEAERLFDRLTQEKQQVEAALSRLPSSGLRVSLQSRLDEVALEKRLERLNRELGSLRMVLKRFHVLRSSANT